MTQVVPGIYRLKIPLPSKDLLLGYINIYLVRGDNEFLLIDTGWDTEEALDSLQQQLAELGVKIKDISQVVVTHFHPDHYGLAGELKQLSRAKISLHYMEKDLIDARYVNMDKLLHQMEQWLRINGVPASELHRLQMASVGMVRFVSAAIPDITIQGGETISVGSFNFQVMWTPGHSPGHICLYESTQKILISGDHILPTITPNIGLNPQSSKNPLGDYLNSLNATKELDVKLVLPGHENPFNGLQQRVDELIGHHEHRNSEIIEALKAEPKTAYQISTEITWLPGINGIGWQDLSPWDKRLAVLETLAHLEALRLSDRIGRISKNGTFYYQRV